MNGKAADKFWNWSLKRYAYEGVEPILLKMQDEFGFNINIALWCCWCAENYDEAPELVIRKAIDLTGQWNTNVTTPLRSARRYLKTSKPHGVENDALRTQIKDAERRAEMTEQSTLQQLAADALADKPDKGDAVSGARRNLAVYTTLIGAAQKRGFTISLLEMLIDYIFIPIQKDHDKP